MTRLGLFLTALAFSSWNVGVIAADEYPVLGVHYMCAPGIDPLECAALHAEAAEQQHDLVRREVSCAKVTGVLSVVKGLGSAATAFCSSFLGIPKVTTVRSTVTPPAR
jgi:hypothetical protein